MAAEEEILGFFSWHGKRGIIHVVGGRGCYSNQGYKQEKEEGSLLFDVEVTCKRSLKVFITRRKMFLPWTCLLGEIGYLFMKKKGFEI